MKFAGLAIAAATIVAGSTGAMANQREAVSVPALIPHFLATAPDSDTHDEPSSRRSCHGRCARFRAA